MAKGKNGNSVFTSYADFIGNYPGGANETINNTIMQRGGNTGRTVYNGLT